MVRVTPRRWLGWNITRPRPHRARAPPTTTLAERSDPATASDDGDGDGDGDGDDDGSEEGLPDAEDDADARAAARVASALEVSAAVAMAWGA